MSADLIWKQVNAHKYKCNCCNYNTHNKALFKRHETTTNHFLRTTVFYGPRDIKVVIASFLPYYKIQYCGKIARHADKSTYLDLPWPDWEFSLCLRRIPAITRDLVDLHVRTDAGVNQTERMTQNLIYESLLW